MYGKLEIIYQTLNEMTELNAPFSRITPIETLSS